VGFITPRSVVQVHSPLPIKSGNYGHRVAVAVLHAPTFTPTFVATCGPKFCYSRFGFFQESVSARALRGHVELSFSCEFDAAQSA
jgi:hypothetical protein